MVAISHIINNGLLLASQSVFQDVATPQQASVEQYNLIKYLGGSAPYIQNPGFGISTDIPDQCTLEQVHLLARHGERYPSKGTGASFEKLYKKLKNSTNTFVGELAFLNDYKYFVTDSEYYEKETSPFNAEGPYAGTSDSLNHGATFRTKYNNLFNNSEKLTVFTSNSGRVHLTAKYFARGALGDDYSDKTVNFAILAEETSLGANSLTPADYCAPFSYDATSKEAESFDTSYLSEAAKRITKGNRGVNLTDSDVLKLFEWCAYEINAKGYSPFCNLFTNDEFLKYSYYADLTFYYLDGPGNNITSTIGAPYLNATLKYLKEDNPPQKVVLAFTHDVNIEHFNSALGLFEPSEHLPSDHIPFPIPYDRPSIVPMGARWYTEKFSCKNETFVRYVVNDAVIPIKGCQDGPGFSCELSDYEDYVNSRLEGKDYATQCEAEDVPDEVTFLWDYNRKSYTGADIDA